MYDEWKPHNLNTFKFDSIEDVILFLHPGLSEKSMKKIKDTLNQKGMVYECDIRMMEFNDTRDSIDFGIWNTIDFNTVDPNNPLNL